MKWTTAISNIKGGSEFIIRGENLAELIKNKSFVEGVYLLLKGELPGENEKRMMNALFLAAIDHGAGAPSATVARTVASTKNSLHVAVAAGILALGELHGSAVEGAARFFQENTGAKDVAALVKELKEKKVRIPGFGHKILDHDERGQALFNVAKETGFHGRHCAFAERVGRELNKISSKQLPLNVDGAMGAIISDMGFDASLAKGFFIIGRVPGLVAHSFEQTLSAEGVKRVDESDIEYVGR